MNTQRRVPRPIGTTEVGQNHHKDPSSENKDKLIQHIINHYNTNNFSYCNKHYNLEEISILLNIDYQQVLNGTISYGQSIHDNMLHMGNQDTLRALYSLVIKGGLEDRSRALEQYSILQASQGATYRPFISGEVNKALKLVMESGTNNASILQGLMRSGQGGNTFNMLFGAPGQQGLEGVPQDAITVDEAVLQLKALGVPTLAEDLGAQERIFNVNNLDDTPEVSARLQTGVDTSKEALNLGNIDALQSLGHIDRRANEEGIDLNDDEL